VQGEEIMTTVRQISIGGNTVGIIGLDEIFDEVRAMKIAEESELKDMIFSKVKARNYVAPGQEDVYREDLFDEYQVHVGQKKSRTRKSGVTAVRVYGAGCPSCKMLDRMVMEVIAAKGLTVDYQYVTDNREIAATGILGSPALAINGKIVAIGNVPSRGQIEKILMEANEKPP
jgi:small redox-active disulfide protein 2